MKRKKPSILATLSFLFFASFVGFIICFIQLVLTEPERALSTPVKPKENTVYFINPRTSDSADWQSKLQTLQKNSGTVELSEQEINAWSQNSIVIPVAENKPFQLHSPLIRFSATEVALSMRLEFQQNMSEQLKTNEFFLHTYGNFVPSSQGFKYKIKATYLNSAKIPWWNPWQTFDSSNLSSVTEAFAKAKKIELAPQTITFTY